MFYTVFKGGMKMHDFRNKQVEVICQHTKKNRILPLRIRLEDEDGIEQTYNIKSYKDVTCHDGYTLPNGVKVTSGNIWSFECKILVLDMLRQVKLYYNSRDNTWEIVK